MKSIRILPIINTVAFLIMIAMNAAANIIPINNLSTGDIASRYPSLFTPSGITFSIWSVIYLLLAGFIFIQWKKLLQSYYKQLSFLFIASCLLNAAWILVWHNLFVALSVVIMIFLLIVLTRIFLLLSRHTFKSFEDIVFIKLPFTIYFAWICVATIANISAYLKAVEWNGVISDTAWTIIMMGIAAMLAIVILAKFRAYAFPAVVIWALIGIALRAYNHITPAAIILIGVLSVTSVVVLLKSNQRKII